MISVESPARLPERPKQRDEVGIHEVVTFEIAAAGALGEAGGGSPEMAGEGDEIAPLT